MIDIRDNRLFIDNCPVGDENYILGILAKARKYDEIMVERERLFLNDPSIAADLAAEKHESRLVAALGSYLEDE